MRLIAQEPKIIVQGMRPEENWWGAYQFPRPYMVNGKILVSVETEKDDIYARNITERWFESCDLAESWHEVEPLAKERAGLVLPNGDIYSLPFGPGIPLEGYKNLDPVASRFYMTPDTDMEEKAAPGELPIPEGMTFFDNGALACAYRASRMPEGLDRAEWTAFRVRHDTGETIRETVPVEWPLLTRVACFPPKGGAPTLKTIQPRGNLKLGPDGALYVTGFSGEGHIMPGTLEYSPYYSAELFKSTDLGKSFTRIGHMEYMADGKKYKYQSGGFSDSDIAFMPDGSMVWFMRSTWACTTLREWDPMYWCRSEDGGHTWSEPEVFAPCGILPRLCTLGCGVTLLVYARPGMYLSAAMDEAGRTWSEPLTLLEAKDRSALCNEPVTGRVKWNQWDGACGNAEIIPLTDTEALVVYGDFFVPDAEGVRRKSIMCRKIKVEL